APQFGAGESSRIRRQSEDIGGAVEVNCFAAAALSLVSATASEVGRRVVEETFWPHPSYSLAPNEPIQTLLSNHSSGEPANDLINLLTLCATSNDSVTAEGLSNPSPHVAVIMARWANFWGSPAKDAAFSQRRKMVAESTAFTPGLVGTIP